MADLSRDEIWDDSSLIDTWNHALQEYKVYMLIASDFRTCLELSQTNVQLRNIIA